MDDWALNRYRWMELYEENYNYRLGIFWTCLISGMKENSEGGTGSQKKLSRTLYYQTS